MKKIILAPVGEYIDDIYVGIREFKTLKVILLSPTNKLEVAYETKKNLEKFKIPTQVLEIIGNIWEETFKQVSQIKKRFSGQDIILHVSTGDRDTRCAATSAAFVHGLKAFFVSNNEMMMLPVLKFSYDTLLAEKKNEHPQAPI